ncbi:MAG: two-component system OmpR family response regulator [Verrucomicrobiales bacterium]
MKVLVVEDEKPIASFVRNGLEEQGYVVDLCHNGTDGLTLATSRSYDAVVLDIMLPGRDGLSILKLLRQRNDPVPVIIITSRGEVEERVEGLNLGADDYLAKPFYISELIARLQSVFRRSVASGGQTLEVEDLQMDLMNRQVRRAGEEVILSPREFNLLVYLMRSPGRVFTRTQILEQVWEYNFDPGSNLVDSCVRRLRQKVDQGYDLQLIETIRGVGYRLRAPQPQDESAA